MRWKIVIGVVAAAALGAVVAALWVGNRVFERTVVPDPYESGLRHDAQRRKAQELGWTLSVDEAGLFAGPQARLVVLLRGRDGAPLDGAEVELRASRAGKPGLDRTVRAAGQGSGRYAVELPLPEPGFWDLDAAIRLRGETLALSQRFQVAPGGCDAGLTACSAEVGDLRVKLQLSPRPPVPLRELEATVDLSREGSEQDGADVAILLTMPGMYMGENRIALRPVGKGLYAGTGPLLRCASGRRDWMAEVVVRLPGRPEARARFPFQAAE